jgi:hypothetical protein
MLAKPETYPALYVIFTLLNAIRRGIERKHIWREFRRQGIALRPRLSFWVAVCKEAGLIINDEQFKTTSHARRWLNKTSEEQIFLLIESWQNAPKNRKARQFRKKLLWKLKYDKPLTQKDLGALNGLEAFGLIAGSQLTKWGKFFIQCEGELPTPKSSEPCKIHEDHLIASIPQQADLLWELENHLRPTAPGKYPLTKRALHFHTGDPYILIDLIERGLHAPMPEQTKAMILQQPSIRIANGIVLEFSSSRELQQLRRQPVFRKYIDDFLSPQRILVSHEKSKGLFQMLKRRGVYVHRNQQSSPVDEEQVAGRQKRTHFPSQQKALLQPIGRSISKFTILEKYKELGQGLDILYRAPGYPAEQRRITPLVIEQRGEQTYIIAYCQTRRAQRTFRLDRIEVPGAW